MIYEFNGYKPVIDESAFIHPLAAVTGNVIIGKDVYIGPGAAIRGDWGKNRNKRWMQCSGELYHPYVPGYNRYPP